MYNERPRVLLPPLSFPGGDVCGFARLASASSSISPPLSASVAASAADELQRMPHFQDGPPLQRAVVAVSGVDLLADLAGLAPPAAAQNLSARPSFLDATASSEDPISRRLPTSPLTLPTPTLGMPPPTLDERDPRWTQPLEQIPAAGPRYDNLSRNFSWAASSPLSPRLPLPSLRPNFINSSGDVCGRLHSAQAEKKEAGQPDMTSPVAKEKLGFGPEYVRQRRQFWSTVLGDIAGSSAVKDGRAYQVREMKAAEPCPRGVMSSAPPPPAHQERAKSVEDYAAHGVGMTRFGNLRQSFQKEHGGALADREARKQLFDAADDQSTSWKREAPVYAATWCANEGHAQETSGGRGSGSVGGSGTVSDAPVAASPRAHACSLCQHRFKRVCDLKKHKAAVHAKLRPFACKQCGKTFGQAGTRSKHYRTVHVGLKPHRCGVCERTFSEKGNMRKHMLRVHQISAPLA